MKESTYKNRYSTIQKHFAYFNKKKVSEIEAINVQTWQLRLAKQFSPNYVRIVQGMLCLAFDRAIILGLAKKNPARMIVNIKSKKVKIDFWTLEEFQKVISLLYKGDYYEHYLFISFWLLFMTGMRIGEAAALQQGYYLLKLLQSPEVDLYFFRFDIADHAGKQPYHLY